MFEQELPGRPSEISLIHEQLNPTLLANMLQVKIATQMQIPLADFIVTYADSFRENLDAHPDWIELYRKDPENLAREFKELLESETTH